MKPLKEISISILDLATIVEGDSGAGDAFARSVQFARLAEKEGYTRYWFAEHHNMESVASSATAVLIGHVAGNTNSIRVGAGGVMLPNHAPLIIAEQFGTLATLFPGRIDLGIGRAPGTDQLTAAALRRTLRNDIREFPNDVQELLDYLGPKAPDAKVIAVPGQDTHVPVWLLGSSTYSAQLAAHLGLPFAFASHFAPTHLHEALHLYRTLFQPSAYLQAPYALACVNVICAETDSEAEYLSTSFYQMALGMIRNVRRPMPRPVENMDELWSEHEEFAVRQMLKYSFSGSSDTVARQLQRFRDETQVDEIMVTTHIHDADLKKRSISMAASLFRKSGEPVIR